MCDTTQSILENVINLKRIFQDLDEILSILRKKIQILCGNIGDSYIYVFICEKINFK